MKIGRYTVHQFVLEHFRLDGGAMFGSVPKTLWQRRIPADEHNRIQLATRVLVLEDDSRRILIDVGMGRKWSDKERDIFAIEYLHGEVHEEIPDVTDVILTHLHFDHGGGITHVNQSGELVLSYPQAQVFVQEANWEHARSPGPRERASYIAANIEPLADARLTTSQDGYEILPDIRVYRANGHTHGMQWIVVAGSDQTLAYAADLIPTAHHVSLPYVMGYDLCAETSMREKEEFLQRAVEEDWIVVFEHDADTAAARITRDSKGRYALGDAATIPEFSAQGR